MRRAVLSGTGSCDAPGGAAAAAAGPHPPTGSRQEPRPSSHSDSGSDGADGARAASALKLMPRALHLAAPAATAPLPYLRRSSSAEPGPATSTVRSLGTEEREALRLRQL